MRKLFVLCFAVFVLAALGCQGSTSARTPAAAVTPLARPTVFRTSVPTNTRVVVITKPPIPMQATTPTRKPSLTPPPTSTEAAGTLKCAPSGAFTKCADNVLAMDFEYPAAWGEIDAVLRQGDTGHAYDYSFSARGQWTMLEAGGRSHDFSEGRGAFITDFMGFGARLPQEVCARFGAAICNPVQPGVILMMAFPKAGFLCNPGPGLFYFPVAIVAVNLPRNPQINGFVFASNFLSSQSESGLMGILDVSDMGAQKCDDASQQQFDARVKEIVANIEAGTVDSETSENIAALMRLAESIRFR